MSSGNNNNNKMNELSMIHMEYRNKLNELCGHEDLLTFFQLRKAHNKLLIKNEKQLNQLPLKSYLKEILINVPNNIYNNKNRLGYPKEFNPEYKNNKIPLNPNDPSYLGSLLGNYDPPSICNIRPLSNDDIHGLNMGTNLQPLI